MRKILVIDDSKVIRARVREMMHSKNVEIIEAQNGVEGLSAIEKEDPYLIVLDFLLPKMGGWEVYQEIQKKQKLRSIPLVIVSGRKEEVTEKLSEPFNNFAFVEKPFDREQLFLAFNDAIQKTKKLALNSNPSALNHCDLNEKMQQLERRVSQLESICEEQKNQIYKLASHIKNNLS